jgi:inorganic pyrophosphatase
MKTTPRNLVPLEQPLASNLERIREGRQNMTRNGSTALFEFMKILFKPHPWHGVSWGQDAPECVTCYIEVVPTDSVKYEIDKTTGYLMVDRPQRFSNQMPCLYGLIPQTYCGSRVAAFSSGVAGETCIDGDHDPLDVCVLTEKAITHGDILLDAIPIGGLRLLDGNEADDKIVAVLKGDAVFGNMREISECPPALVQRLVHYFLTYKQMPDAAPVCEVTHIYTRAEAHRVILASRADYDERFSGLLSMLEEVMPT